MRSKIAAIAAGAALALVLSGCSGSATPSESSDGPLEISFLTGSAEGTGSAFTMQTLVDDYGNDATLSMDYLGADMDQKIQLMASQDALPTFFQVGTPSQIVELYETGKIIDLEPVLEELGVLDKLNPLSVDIIKNLYGGHLVGLPLEVAIEGFWYNEQIFADNDIEIPETWDDLAAAAEKLQAAGIQPFATAGKAGWPVTRLISGYISRDVGPDALPAAAAGDAAFTDPEYVAGAQVISDFAAAGYFGEAPDALEYAPAEDQFLQGNAAIYYMGSWAISSFEDEERNQIGADNIGWFPVPNVDGGAGDSAQTPANVGLPMAVTAKTLTPQVKEFLKYLVENYGDVAMENLDLITGFATDKAPESELVAETLERVNSTTESIGWFESSQSSKGTTASQEGATALIGGSLTAEDFMAQVQAAQ
ncbi:carbohydrate ABC transporter substrate-binding protein [Microbacterium trichothecenolyticum]|uniref:Carbohydrate ABC transporter substrate-binding protein n=1 Tax=Microbacterium ureisolvens TaxID=2781186 RepID=A0ABS7I322_9MICO|nr:MULTISPECIES: ABC transporter substrate-binding protein [Microbacterium]MBW9111953.1 carbohydrate ABC transporter substrate-binding protein [Microbacterium ureisolvens]MBW9122378.1 carbohydrate ABC transporter substrate-binding protein [Microbacterium trichothecenolyticum]